MDSETVNFRLSDFPNFINAVSENGVLDKHTDWQFVFKDMGYNIIWDHYAAGKKFIKMDNTDYTWFALKWS
jgi:hypothetical protein